MNLMNGVLADYLDGFVIVFLDDILIYSKTIEDYVVCCDVCPFWSTYQQMAVS